MYAEWSESDIQSLKAQEAKDLAVEFLIALRDKDRSPITPGQVQLKELEYGLKIKEAELEDARRRNAHAERVKELELEIEQERTRQAERTQDVDQVRSEHAQLVEQVQAAKESMSVQLERATAEHNAKIESLEAAYAERKQALEAELSALQQQKLELSETIQELTDMAELAQDVAQLREEVESRRVGLVKESERLDDEFEQSQFEKNKRINQVKRDQEVELLELETQHRVQVTQRNLDAAKAILSESGLMAVVESDWSELRAQAASQRQRDEAALDDVRKQAEAELKRTYNITTAEVLDVTELFYREKALAREAAAYRDQLSKMDTEITRMRQHIESEPERISKAVEAAKVQIQNHIEQARSR